MDYYLLEGSATSYEPTPKQMQAAIQAHLAYLKAGFEDGTILMSGPLEHGGGIILVKSEDIDRFCREDPVVKLGIHQYRIMKFNPHDCQPFVRQWFQ